jgi:transposase InsO family protein
MKKHPNKYVRKELSAPDQAYVSDITYVESEEGVHYLSLVTDAYSRKIVGYKLSLDMKAENVVQAFEKAVKGKYYKNQLMHHSDRGSQYCSERYQSSLRRHGVVPSMTDGYDCYQNALAERVNGILKQEFLLYKCKTFKELKALIKESIRLYNECRPHLSLGMKTPDEVHKKGQLLT